MPPPTSLGLQHRLRLIHVPGEIGSLEGRRLFNEAGEFRQAGQRLGIKEVDEGIWLVSFMRYDLGYFDLEQKTLQPLDNPFGTRLSPMS